MHGNVASAPHLRRIGTALTICAVAAILFATLLPESGQPPDSHLCLVCGPLGGVDSILNVLLFAPLGAGLAFIGIRWNRSVLIACALSLAVETVQILIPGRDAALGDIVTNTIGAAFGFVLASNPQRWLQPHPRSASILGFAWCGIWVIIQAISSFAFAPAIPDSTYFGEIAPELGSFDVFPGRVLSASIGDLVIANARLDASDSIARKLREGRVVAATVVAGGPTTRIAPIIRVADSAGRELLLLGQEGRDLVFGVRSGAGILRLRPPLFALPQVFPAEPASQSVRTVDTLGLRGALGRREVTMNAGPGSGTRSSKIALTPGLAWTLVLPGQWAIEGTRTELILSLIWMALLTFPVGYWAAFGTISRRRPDNSVLWTLLVWPVGIAMLAVGLGLASYAFGLPIAPVREWLAVLAGVCLGAGFSAWARQANRGNG